MEAKSSNLSVLLEEGVKRGCVKMDFETEIRFGSAVQKIIIISTSRRASSEFLNCHVKIDVAAAEDIECC